MYWEQHLADGEFFIKFHIYINYFYYSCLLFIDNHTSPVKSGATKGRHQDFGFNAHYHGLDGMVLRRQNYSDNPK